VCVCVCVYKVLIPYRLVLLCLLCQRFASLFALNVELLALQLLHGRLIFLLGETGLCHACRGAADSAVVAVPTTQSHQEGLLKASPTFTLLSCSS